MIDEMLNALEAAARRTSVTFRELAWRLSHSELNRAGVMRAFIDELHWRFVYAANPIEHLPAEPPLEKGLLVDVDEACLFVVALAGSVGIPCRFVAARYSRAGWSQCWTLRVAYEDEDGRWSVVDVLRQNTDVAVEEIRL